jgi:hypothetical protein
MLRNEASIIREDGYRRHWENADRSFVPQDDKNGWFAFVLRQAQHDRTSFRVRDWKGLVRFYQRTGAQRSPVKPGPQGNAQPMILTDLFDFADFDCKRVAFAAPLTHPALLRSPALRPLKGELLSKFANQKLLR